MAVGAMVGGLMVGADVRVEVRTVAAASPAAHRSP